MKEVALAIVSFFAVVCLATAQGQQTNVCDHKKVITSLPPGILAELNAAAREVLKTGNFEKVKGVVNQPGSGLKISIYRQAGNGGMNGYVVTDSKGCDVARGGSTS
jgi:hypothetical protein